MFLVQLCWDLANPVVSCVRAQSNSWPPFATAVCIAMSDPSKSALRERLLDSIEFAPRATMGTAPKKVCCSYKNLRSVWKQDIVAFIIVLSPTSWRKFSVCISRDFFCRPHSILSFPFLTTGFACPLLNTWGLLMQKCAHAETAIIHYVAGELNAKVGI